MKRNGFTLIELLAVIVILAIIALIATPIILGIIKDTKKEADKRSAENYLAAVKLAVARKNMDGNFKPTKCEIVSEGLVCEGYEQPLKIRVDGEFPTGGTIYFENGIIKPGTNLQIGEVVATLNSNKKIEIGKEKLIIEGDFYSVCELASDSTEQGKEIGAKYNCKVSPQREKYTFFILSYNDKNGNIVRDEKQAETINLIMDSNIRTGGETVKEIEPIDNQNGLVAWNSEAGQTTTIYGPVTVMKYLYEATLDWTNVLPVNFEYYDKEFQGIVEKEGGYLSFESTNGVASINGTALGFEKLLRTRIPVYSKDPLKTELQFISDNNLFLFEYLHGYSNPVNKVKGVYAYWSFSTEGYLESILTVHTSGSISGCTISSDNYVGVRPVITLDI